MEMPSKRRGGETRPYFTEDIMNKKITVAVAVLLAIATVSLLLSFLQGPGSAEAATPAQSEASSTYVILHSDTITNGNGSTVAPIGAFDTYAELTVQAEGIVSGTLNWEGTIDGSTWYAILGTSLTSGNAAATAAADGLYRMDVTGLASVRARVTDIVTNTTDTIDVAGFLTAP